MFSTFIKIIVKKISLLKTNKQIRSNQVAYLLNLRRHLKIYSSSVRKFTLEVKNKSSECNCISYLYNSENCVISIRSDIV